MKQRTIYISGPISGLDRSEYMRRFAKAERLLQREGFRVVNPTRFLVCRWPWLYKLVGYRLTLLYDLWRLSHCDFIYKMPGWRESKGAQIESCWAWNTRIWYVPKRLCRKLDELMEREEVEA